MEKHLGDGPTPLKNRSVLDIAILGVVVVVAGVVVALSFTNTTKLAEALGLQPILTAGLVELLFASLLFIRARQRATRRNVPRFLSAGYFASLAFVTGVNMWGLGIENPTIGPVVGAAISGAMWLMESVLVWLWTASHRPHEKSLRELKREAKARRKAAKLKQEIEWMDWLAQKPDMALVRRARREEEKRKAIVAGGLPLFFDQAESATRNTAASESTRGIGACENTPANTSTATTRTGTSETGTTNDNVNNINTRTGITTTSTMPPVARYISENTTRTTSGIGDDVGNTSITTGHSRTRGAGSTIATRDEGTNEGTSTGDNGTRKNTTTGTTRKKNTATARDESTSEGTSTTTTNTETINTSTRESTRKKASTTTSRKAGGHLRLVDADLEQVKKVAMAIYEKEGKLPGRPRLRKEAQCKENHARRVLAELKHQLEAI